MNQPAKAQEPTMEEILASIRRIIADDDTTKPSPKAADPVPPPPAAPPMAQRPEPVPPPPRAAPVVPPPKPAPEPAMRQADIDAMLSNLNATAPSEPVEEPPAPDILDLTESMAAEDESANFRTIDGQSDVVFEERPFEPEPPPRGATLSARSTPLGIDDLGGQFGVQYACPHGAGAERPYARGSGARNVAADAQVVAR